MASPNTNWSEILTTTLYYRAKKLADNVSENNALLNRLSKRGKVKTFDSGVSILQPLEYTENSTFTRYSGYETLNASPSDVFTNAEFAIKQAAVSVTISGLEELQNSGQSQIFDLLESRIANAERTMQNNIAADIYSDGTASGGKQIGGLQLLVPDDPTTGTVGGINRATWTFWQPKRYRGVTDGGAAVSASNIQSYMNRLWLQLVRGTDRPDLIIADNTYYRYYWESLQAIQRITSEDTGMAGFNSLKFMDADVVFDGGYGGNAPANHMYFLNTDYIFYRPHAKRNMVPLDNKRFSVNQDAMVQYIAFAGNMTLSNSFLQGNLQA